MTRLFEEFFITFFASFRFIFHKRSIIYSFCCVNIFISSLSFAAAPSRTYNYVSHTTIDPSQNNTNENSLYSYLQSGVDTYAAGTIDNTAISSIAGISYSKLNLLGSIKNADISVTAGIVGSKLDLTAPGIIGSVTPAAGTFTTLTGTNITGSTSITASTLLTSSTATVLNGTVNLGSTHQGDIFYDNGSSVVRLVPGTAGQVLSTGGAAANPSWAGAGMKLISATAVAAASSSNIAITATKQYMVLASVTYSSGNITGIQFNADGGGNYKYLYNGRTTGGALTGGASGAALILTGTAPLANTQVNMLFYIYPQSGTQVQTHGHISYVDSAGSLLSFTDFAGYWDNSAAVTSFRLSSQAGATITGTVYLYEISQT